MQRLLLVGLNHTTAPLDLRERVVFSAEQRGRALAALKQKYPEAEGVILSTCNRVELYVSRTVHGHPREEEMAEFLAAFHGVNAVELAAHLYRKTDREAAGHLFSVTASLDSMVLGETQILGQVRQAYEEATSAGSAGALLHPLFQRALAVAKRVMTQTTLNEGRVSVASVAVDYARRIFDRFEDKTVLSIGAGKMAALVLRSFAALRPGRLLVCNRDAQKAAALAEQFGGEPAPFEALHEHLTSADIVISSTGAPHAIITRSSFESLVSRRRYRPIFMIDIALPRDIEPGVGQIENVYLYNIDDLQQEVAQTLSARGGAVESARKIVDAEVADFATWNRARELGPVINLIYQRFHEMAQEEVARTVNKLGGIGDAEKEHLQKLAHRIVNKLLHDPIRTLKQADGLHGPGAQYLHAMERLFGLEKEERQQDEAASGEAKE
jgi:glutamyl-tRNA reductase